MLPVRLNSSGNSSSAMLRHLCSWVGWLPCSANCRGHGLRYGQPHVNAHQVVGKKKLATKQWKRLKAVRASVDPRLNIRRRIPRSVGIHPHILLDGLYDLCILKPNAVRRSNNVVYNGYRGSLLWTPRGSGAKTAASRGEES